MPRKPFIAGNWKLNLTSAEGAVLIAALVPVAASCAAEVAVFPTALSVQAMVAAANGTAVGVGAQNCHWEEKGAFTGEISASLIKSCGARYVLIGHSERRQFFGETDQTVNKRLVAVLRQGLVPIVCIGETLAERDGGQLAQVLERQVRGALAGITPDQLQTMVVAYEPVWAIGTGRTATTQQAQEAHAVVRGLLHAQIGDLANSIRIQYGGSVKPSNAKELLSQPDVDGALVGGASLTSADFIAILRAS